MAAVSPHVISTVRFFLIGDGGNRKKELFTDFLLLVEYKVADFETKKRSFAFTAVA